MKPHKHSLPPDGMTMIENAMNDIVFCIAWVCEHDEESFNKAVIEFSEFITSFVDKELDCKFSVSLDEMIAIRREQFKDYKKGKANETSEIPIAVLLDIIPQTGEIVDFPDIIGDTDEPDDK